MSGWLIFFRLVKNLTAILPDFFVGHEWLIFFVVREWVVFGLINLTATSPDLFCKV